MERREDDRPELLRPALLRLDLFRLELLRLELFRPREREEDLRAELRPRLDDLPPALLADRRALFLAPLRDDFLLLRLAERLEDFRRGLGRAVGLSSRRLGDGSSKSNERDGDAGDGEGVLSEGRGSIQPEPDQPISI